MLRPRTPHPVSDSAGGTAGGTAAAAPGSCGACCGTGWPPAGGGSHSTAPSGRSQARCTVASSGHAPPPGPHAAKQLFGGFCVVSMYSFVVVRRELGGPLVLGLAQLFEYGRGRRPRCHHPIAFASAPPAAGRTRARCCTRWWRRRGGRGTPTWAVVMTEQCGY